MIYTVTFNPSLDYIVTVDDFQLGMTNRTETELLLPGGKGINVSLVLTNLGMENRALGFVAGFTGEAIVREIERMGVQSDFIRLEQGLSRINLKLKNIDGTEINGQGPNIATEKLEMLLEKLGALQEGDILVLAGSIPGSLPDDIYEKIMSGLAGKDIEVVVDASRRLLKNVLPYKPFLIKPNHHELGELFGVQLQSRQEVIPYAQKLQEMGARNVLVSMAEKGAVLLTEDNRILEADAPEGKLVNGVGAGDSMVAGFLAGWMKHKDYVQAFAMGLAAGSASAFSDRLATREETEVVYARVTVEEHKENADA